MVGQEAKIRQFKSFYNSGAIDSANSLFSEIVNDLFRELYPLSVPGRPQPKYLVHYTSLDALFSMIDRDKPGYLRLYDTFHSNDPTEGAFFHECLNQDEPSTYSCLPDLLRRQQPEFAYISSFVLTHSLSKADKLAYWLAYGCNGYGCSIAIPLSDFTSSLPVLPVQYGKPAVRHVGNRLVSFFNKLPTTFLQDSAANDDDSNALLRVFKSIPYFHKPKSYSYESECRLFLSPLHPDCNPVFHQLQYSSGVPFIRHYVDHPSLQLSGIFFTGTVITIGPSNRAYENIQHTIRSLLRHHRLTGPTVKNSRIPYRPSTT